MVLASFYLQFASILPPSFESIGLLVQEKRFKTDFQDGHYFWISNWNDFQDGAVSAILGFQSQQFQLFW